MRMLLSATLWLMFAAELLHAQSCPPHPTDAGATLDTSFIAVILLPSIDPLSRANDSDFLLDAEELKAARAQVCVFRTSPGGYDYVIVPGSIEFDAGSETIDGYSTRELFSVLSEAAVHQAIVFGKSPCGTSGTHTVKVWSDDCVQRSGTGSSTQFAACTSASSCYRTFSIACSTPASVTPMSSTGSTSSCWSNCDWTCP